MSARDELAEVIWDEEACDWRQDGPNETAAAILAAGYRKTRTITSAYQLESLPFGTAVQTSDESDMVVLRCEGNDFRNQSGFELSATDLWRYGTRPFILLYEPEPQP